MMFSERDCVDAVLYVSEVVGEDPSISQYRSHRRESDPCVRTVIYHCTGWNEAKRLCGFDVSESRSLVDFDEESCISALQRVSEVLGKSPTLDEYHCEQRDDEPSYSRIVDLFSSWNTAKTEASLRVYNAGDGVSYPYGSNWGSVSSSVRERDECECVNCGVSNEDHTVEYGRSLDVHHVYKLREFVDLTADELTMLDEGSMSVWLEEYVESQVQKANHPSNLITLCRACHSRFEEMPPESQLVKLDRDSPKYVPESVKKERVRDGTIQTTLPMCV